MQIHEAIIHQLVKIRDTHGDDSVQIKPRASLLTVDTVLIDMAQSLRDTYAENISGYGSLGSDPDLHRFPILMQQYLDASTDTHAFIVFTKATVKLIAETMKNERFATGGYALFLRYSSQGSEWLLVVMLKLKHGAGVDPVSLDLQQTLTFDIGKLHEAARINLGKWTTDDQPYLSFVKPRTKGSAISEYFRNALACLHFTDSKHHTQQVIQALDDFVESRVDIAPDNKRDQLTVMRQRLYECFVANPTEVVLDTLSAYVMPNEPLSFKEFIRTGSQSTNYQINDAFKPDKHTFSQIRRLKAKMGSVSVAFDVADVQQQRVKYD